MLRTQKSHFRTTFSCCTPYILEPLHLFENRLVAVASPNGSLVLSSKLKKETFFSANYLMIYRNADLRRSLAPAPTKVILVMTSVRSCWSSITAGFPALFTEHLPLFLAGYASLHDDVCSGQQLLPPIYSIDFFTFYFFTYAVCAGLILSRVV